MDAEPSAEPILEDLHPFGWQCTCTLFPELRTWGATQELALAHFRRATDGLVSER